MFYVQPFWALFETRTHRTLHCHIVLILNFRTVFSVFFLKQTRRVERYRIFGNQSIDNQWPPDSGRVEPGPAAPPLRVHRRGAGGDDGQVRECEWIRYLRSTVVDILSISLGWCGRQVCFGVTGGCDWGGFDCKSSLFLNKWHQWGSGRSNG